MNAHALAALLLAGPNKPVYVAGAHDELRFPLVSSVRHAKPVTDDDPEHVLLTIDREDWVRYENFNLKPVRASRSKPKTK